MNPMLFPLIVGGLVVAMVVLLYLAFSKGSNEAASDRLDALVNNRGIRKESSADLLLKQAIDEADKKSLLDLAARQGPNGGWEFAMLSFPR